MTVFTDTSALYALLDRDDVNYAQASGAWSDLLKRGDALLTSNYVLLETLALVQSRLGIDAVRAFQEDVRPMLIVRWITEEEHRVGVESLLAARRRRLSVADCVSFQLMREQGIRAVFCFDRHFQEQGFDLIPAASA